MNVDRTIRERSWKVVQLNTIVIVCGLIGLFSTFFEKDTSPGSTADNLDKLYRMKMNGFRRGFVNWVKMVLTFVILVKGFTKELYIACYIVMIYAFASDNRGIVIPWLIVNALRCIFVEAVTCFTGCYICAHYPTLRYPCFDFVLSKGFQLACSVSLWAIVYEAYMGDSTNIQRPRQRSPTTTNNMAQVRSIDSVLAEAIVEWFLEEADRCKRFDSKLAVDEDITKFEDELTNRAAKFLELSPEEILEEGKRKHGLKRYLKIQSSTQTEKKKGINFLQKATPIQELIKENQGDGSLSNLNSVMAKGSSKISEIDMQNKNPLRKFPYLPHVTESLSDDFGNNALIGSKNISIQTFTEEVVNSASSEEEIEDEEEELIAEEPMEESPID